jgi:hypothetical protein
MSIAFGHIPTPAFPGQTLCRTGNALSKTSKTSEEVRLVALLVHITDPAKRGREHNSAVVAAVAASVHGSSEEHGELPAIVDRMQS